MALLLELNSTGKITKCKTIARVNRAMPTSTRGPYLKIRPPIRGHAKLGPKPATGTIMFLKDSGEQPAAVACSMAVSNYGNWITCPVSLRGDTYADTELEQ